MGKKHKKSQNKSRRRFSKKRKSIFLWIGGIIAFVLILSLFSSRLSFLNIWSKRGKSFYVQGGETRSVLSPSLFIGRAREAYAAARQYPEVMDQVFCYCKCDEPPTYHKSLLSCYTERHGEG